MQHCILIQPNGERYNPLGARNGSTFMSFGTSAEELAWMRAAKVDFGYLGARWRAEPHRRQNALLVLDRLGLWKKTDIVFPEGEGNLAEAMRRLLEGTGWRVVETDFHGNEISDYDLIADETS